MEDERLLEFKQIFTLRQ